MKDNEQQALKLLTFDNRLRDDLAHFVSYTEGFLWRRDLARIVALRLPNRGSKSHLDYPIHDIIAKQTPEKMELDDNMTLHIKTSEGKYAVSPIERTLPHSLKYTLRKEQEFEWEGKMNVKALKQVLLICEQKWMISKEEEPNIIFDFKNSLIKMKGREEEFPMPFEGEKGKNATTVTFAFHLLKDMMYNNEKYIFFRISRDYTVFEYGNQLYGVLMHISKEEEYPQPLRN